MVDMSKITKSIIDNVDNIKKLGGKANQIDTKEEAAAIGNLLSGAGKYEKEYYEELLDQYYSPKTKSQDITPALKSKLEGIAKFAKGSDKCKIDDENEAVAVANLLRDSQDALTAYEQDFLKELLKRSGFENYIPGENKTEPESQTQPKSAEESNSSKEGKDINKQKHSNIEGTPRKSIPPRPQTAKLVTNTQNNTNNQTGAVNVSGNNNTIVIQPKEPDSADTTAAQSPDSPNSVSQGNPAPARRASREELSTLANQIFDAIDGPGTKDNQLENAMQDITKDNILELLEVYNQRHPDMFASVLDDLSGTSYTKAVMIFKDALVERSGNDPEVARQARNIDAELQATWRDDDTIVNALHEMVRRIKSNENQQ